MPGKIFHDVMSGARDDRPGFAECMRYLREGDTLIVWRLDRLGRMRGIVNTLHELTERGLAEPERCRVATEPSMSRWRPCVISRCF